MKAYIINLWDAARASFWFVPAMLGFAALALGIALPMLDSELARSQYEHWSWIQTTTETARSTLSALVGAMVGVVGTVFSITIVTLCLTSQQFGPRLLRTFMHNFPTQVTLGVFLSTAVYCLLVLRTIEASSDSYAAPQLSVSVAMALAVLSIATLIFFIHHISMMIQAPSIVQAVAIELDEAIHRLFPERIGKPSAESDEDEQLGLQQEASLSDDARTVPSNHEGYIQAVDGEGLLSMASRFDLVVRLRKRPGEFLRKGEPLAEVWRADDRLDKVAARINESFIVGIRRTPRQDVECAVNELAEVAVRSLSPGINDPFTAMNCIDRLGASLGRLAQRKTPSAYRFDSEGELRLIARPVSFPGVLDAAFNQIRQYGRQSVAVTIRLLETFEGIANSAECDSYRQSVRHHAEMVMRGAEHYLSEEEDRRAVRERFDRLAADVAESGI